jgi:hypothetical protein
VSKAHSQSISWQDWKKLLSHGSPRDPYPPNQPWEGKFSKCQKIGRWDWELLEIIFFFQFCQILDWETLLGTLGDPLSLHFLIVGYTFIIFCLDMLHFNQLWVTSYLHVFWTYTFFTMFYLFCKPITVLQMSSSSSLEASYQQKVCPILLSHCAFMDLAHLYFT